MLRMDFSRLLKKHHTCYDGSMKLAIILGSTRQGRLGARIATWVMQTASAMNADTELLDLKEIQLPFYDEPKTPDDLGGKYSHPAAQLWHDKIKAADRIIFITPEYNHSYPGVLKNAVDHLAGVWKNKPYLIVSYSAGAWAGVRAAMQLRALLDYMGLTCRGELNLPQADQHITPDGVLTDQTLAARLQKLLANLLV